MCVYIHIYICACIYTIPEPPKPIHICNIYMYILIYIYIYRYAGRLQARNRCLLVHGLKPRVSPVELPVKILEPWFDGSLELRV